MTVSHSRPGASRQYKPRQSDRPPVIYAVAGGGGGVAGRVPAGASVGSGGPGTGSTFVTTNATTTATMTSGVTDTPSAPSNRVASSVEVNGSRSIAAHIAPMPIARGDVDVVDDVALLELLDHQVLAAVLAILRVVDVLARQHRGQLLERVAQILRDARERLVEHVVADRDADALRALELNLAQHELIEHLLLDHRHRRQLPALFGRLLRLLLAQVADDDVEPFRRARS